MLVSEDSMEGHRIDEENQEDESNVVGRFDISKNPILKNTDFLIRKS